MKLRWLVGFFTVALAASATARADVITFKNGSTADGVIKKVENGRVTIDVEGMLRVFDILEVESMDFTTPHLLEARGNIPVEHFMTDREAQELVRHVRDIDKAADQIETQIKQIRAEWLPRQPIPADQEATWNSTKDAFRRPLSLYQELLNDMYFHLLSKVDRYNLLMKAASDVYVGVKGPFNAGSGLVSKEFRELPLKKYVPRAWYDTIFYDGYNAGYNDAYERLDRRTRGNGE
jgi:hypothetical protein